MREMEIERLISLVDAKDSARALALYRKWEAVSSGLVAASITGVVYGACIYLGATPNVSAGIAVMALIAQLMKWVCKGVAIEHATIAIATFCGGFMWFKLGLPSAVLGFAVGLGAYLLIPAASVAVDVANWIARLALSPALKFISARIQEQIKLQAPQWYCESLKLTLGKTRGARLETGEHRVFVSDEKNKRDGQAAQEGFKTYSLKELRETGILCEIGAHGWHATSNSFVAKTAGG